MPTKELYMRISSMRSKLNYAITERDKSRGMDESILSLSQELDELIAKYVLLVSEGKAKGKSTE